MDPDADTVLEGTVGAVTEEAKKLVEENQRQHSQ